jgi:UDP-N-acetylglucosamine:LPS N-acetylglucosamine transferase
VPVLEVDRPPLADASEQELWGRTRRFYEAVSRLSTVTGGAPVRALLDGITHIPSLHPRRDLSAPTLGARGLDRLAANGMGLGLARWLEEREGTLLTTFYAPAVTSDKLSRRPVFCVVTDSDVNRVWAPLDAGASRVRFFAPSRRVVRRLEAYGVRPDRIRYTGYPLPGELVGGRERAALHRNLAARLVRLDPGEVFIGPHRAELERVLGPLPAEQRGRPPHVVFAVGGAGAQVNIADELLPGIVRPLAEGKLRLTLVAGVRDEVAVRFRAAIERSGARGVEILVAPDVPAYLRAFNALLAETDVLWSKPSEITFFAALGLPLVFSPPVGVHEGYNRRWAVESGAGLRQHEPALAAGWLGDWIADGILAGAAWSGATRLPSLGLYDIADEVRGAL